MPRATSISSRDTERVARSGRPTAWHSAKGNVHHNNPRCARGARVGRNRRPGDGGKPLCTECQGLNEAGAHDW
jgi:hypothetical protein